MRKEIEQAMKDCGMDTLLPVQTGAIPRIENKESLMIQAKTGAGKTACYLLPILNEDRKALIVCPTRELAMQVHDECKKLSSYTKIHSALVIGGVDYRVQENAFRHNPTVIIGTPGRLVDLFRRNMFNITFDTLVLDEADQIFSTGQYDDMKEIVDSLPIDIQTICFSATWSEQFKDYFRSDYETIVIDDASVNSSIETYHMLCESKYQALKDILFHENIEKAIVFVNYRSTCTDINEKLHKRGILSQEFSGHQDERRRIKTMKEFKEGKIRVLIATDAAARGLDITHVSHIIHYDIPLDYETYIHRSGRTAHQNNEGIAITLIEKDDKENPIAQQIIAETKEFRPSGKARKLTTPLHQKKQGTPETQTFIIKAGRNDKLRPTDVIGALCTKIPYEQIGVLEIQDRYTTVTILNNDKNLINSLHRLPIKGKKRTIEKMKK